MIEIRIEEKGKVLEYQVAEYWTEHFRKLILFGEGRPLLIRYADGNWYCRDTDCNFCGECCASPPDTNYKGVPNYMKQLGVKEMGGRWVCKYLEKEIWAEVPETVPIDPDAPENRKIGDPLKSRTNATVYVCKTTNKPFKCCATPVCIEGKTEPCAPGGCTLLFKRLG